MYNNYLIDNFYLLIAGTLSAGLLIVFLVQRYFAFAITQTKSVKTLSTLNKINKQNLNNNSNHYTNGKLLKLNGNGSKIYNNLQNINESEESEGSIEVMITKKIVKSQEYEKSISSTSDSSDQLRNDEPGNDQNDIEQVEEAIESIYNLVNTEPEVRTQKVSDFAAIILTDDKRQDFCEIVCITSGSDIIDAQNLEPEFVVIDCRAPVLARRALIRYLYQKLSEVIAHEVLEEEAIIAVIPASNRFELKKNFKFNLLVSEPPDGPDGSRQQRGVESVRLKSTIDKISVWNQVGVQGSLLSHFLDPIYINSVIIPVEFNEMSFHRHFVLNYTKEPKLLTKCENSLIEDIRERLEWARVEGWPDRVASNWIATEDGLELIDCSTGRAVPDLSTSRLSKHSLNKCFRQFLSQHEHSLRPNQSLLPITYRKWKESAPNYRIQKQLLKVRYAVAGRQWISLSPDLDFFV